MKELIDPDHADLSERKQCDLLGITRSTLYYEPVCQRSEDIECKRALDEIYLKDPCLGSRRLIEVLRRDYGLEVGRKRLCRLRREMGLSTIYCRPRTSLPGHGHRRYPYLLRDLEVTRPDQVWCADITYIPMAQGNAFLCAVMDWYSRKVLGWTLSNTMDNKLCLDALQMALDSGRKPEIFNTDQGSQFTCEAWLSRLEGEGIRVSMDGRGRWLDNVFIERLWRSLKYEEIYLHECGSVHAQRERIGIWFERYNNWRPHQAFGNKTPSCVYESFSGNSEKTNQVA